jgi:hypothetical protein
MGGDPAAKAAFEAAERTDDDPAWDRDCSCLALGDNVGPAVFVTAPNWPLEATDVIFVEENGEGPGVRLRRAAK